MPVLDIATVIIKNIETGNIEIIRIGKLFSKSEKLKSKDEKSEVRRSEVRRLEEPGFLVWSHQGWTKIKAIHRRRMGTEEKIYALHNSSNWIYATGETRLLLAPSRGSGGRNPNLVDQQKRLVGKYIPISALQQIIADYIGMMQVRIDDLCNGPINGIKLYECSSFPQGDGPDLYNPYVTDGISQKVYCDRCGENTTFGNFYHCDICEWDICDCCYLRDHDGEFDHLECRFTRSVEFLSTQKVVCLQGHLLKFVPYARKHQILSTNNLEQQKLCFPVMGSSEPFRLSPRTWTGLQYAYTLGTHTGHRMFVSRSNCAAHIYRDLTCSNYLKNTNTWDGNHKRRGFYSKYRESMNRNYPKQFKVFKFLDHPTDSNISYDPWLSIVNKKYRPNDGSINAMDLENIANLEKYNAPPHDRNIIYFNRANEWLYSLKTANGFYHVGLGKLVLGT